MRIQPFRLALFAAFPLLLASCELLEGGSGLLNAAKVTFSEGSPAVDGQTVDYSGSLLSTPSLDKFHFKMVFHVKADNSENAGRAAFGSETVKPILNFRVNSRSGTPIATAIPAFSIDGGAVADLEFPIEIPLTAIDKATARKIVNGDPLPYYLSGTLQFQVLEGTTLKGSGKTELDLTSGEIATRPSGSVVGLLSGLL